VATAIGSLRNRLHWSIFLFFDSFKQK